MELTQFKMNLPNDLKVWLDTRRAANMRSRSAEVILVLREKMAAEGKIGVQTSAAGCKTEKDC